MKSRAPGHKSDESCNHRKDLFLLWAFLLFQGCKLSYWWYLGWTHSSLKECILLHFHGKGVQLLWSSLSAAGCGAGSRSIFFRVVTQQLLDSSCGKHKNPSACGLCSWQLLALGGLGVHWLLLGELAQELVCQDGWHGTRDAFPKPVWSARLCDSLSWPPVLSCCLKYRHISFHTAFITSAASL